jgi:hypothetical protein
MNSFRYSFPCAFAACCIALNAAEPPARVKMRDVITHDEIVESAKKAREEMPAPVFTPATGEDPSVANKLGDLISRSDVLCYRGQATLVPKRAVLHIPKSMADRIGMVDGARLGSWTEFLNANRAWIRTVPVTRIQAEGNDPMPEATLKSFQKEQRLVVATYQDGPISVLPLKVPEPEPVAGTPAANPPGPVVVTSADPVTQPTTATQP